MSGCYGNHPEDRHFEAMLNNYLEEHDRNPEDESLAEEAPDVGELQLQIKFLSHQHKNDEVAARMLLGLLDSAKETIGRLEAELFSLRPKP
jgi:hypothetical protein